MQTRAHFFTKPGTLESLSPAGWRYFAGLTRGTLDVLWAASRREYADRSHLIPLLNLVSKTGERPPLALLKRLLHDLLNIRHQISSESYAEAETSLVRFIRLAAQQALIAKKKGRLNRFVSGEFNLAIDWLRQREPRVVAGYAWGPSRLSSVPKNATWASIMRAQQTWHTELVERERIQREENERAHREYMAKQDATTWASALPACEVKGATVTPLVTGKDLREEGERMNHCVGTYVAYCDRGTSRIFGIKLQDEQATLELHESGSNMWKVRQVFGPGNSEVSKPLAAISKTVAKMYTTAAKAANRRAAA